MRIAFVTASLAWRAPDGATWTNAGLGRLIEALAARVDRLQLAISHVGDRGDQHDHRVSLGRADVKLLPTMPSVAAGLAMGLACHRVIEPLERDADVTVVQLPFSAPSALAPVRRPRVYHVCADLPEVVRASRYYRGARRFAALGLAHGIDLFQGALIAAPHSRAVTNGEVLLGHYGGRGRAVVSSTLKATEIASVRRARPVSAPFRVLFVGFLRPEKGVDVLVEAFERLVADDANVELVIVGGSDLAETGAAAELVEKVRALESRGLARRTGQVPFGGELFRHYADADVLVLPSRSEGTPRVLVEARAFGCPVVATRVGGIPTSVKDGDDGLLVPPDDAAALHLALRRVRTDTNLRARLVERGLARARATTVDAQAEAILAEAALAAA